MHIKKRTFTYKFIFAEKILRTRDTDKEKLVKDNAIDQIVTDGFQGFSMNKLAKSCKISVATLYIYYRDKDDMIKKIGTDIGKNFFTSTLKDFSSQMPFESGLWIQWKNRSDFALKFPKEVACLEVIKHSPHGDLIFSDWEEVNIFKKNMRQFLDNAVQNNELVDLPLEIFWSVAYGPLYNLLSFHREGKSFGGEPFSLTPDVLEKAFKIVIKALKP